MHGVWSFQVRRQALDFPHIERLFLTSEHIYWLSWKNERAVPSPMTREHIYVGTRDNFNEPQSSWYISSRVNLYRTLDKLRIKIHGLNCFRCGLTKWWIKILWWMSIFFSKLMDNDNFSDKQMKRNKKDRITDHFASLWLTFSELVLCPQKGPCLMGFECLCHSSLSPQFNLILLKKVEK